METILIVIHLMIVVALVVVVLLQRSEGGALGIGGGGGGMMSARGAANALTKVTGILAAGFFITSLSLGILARYGSQPTDILDQLPSNQGQQSEGGSLLDQLGGLPSDDTNTDGAATPAASGADTSGDNTGGAADDASPSLIPDASGGSDAEPAPSASTSGETQSGTDTPQTDSPAAATGADSSLLLDQPAETDSEQSDTGAVEPIPANPGETAPNAADPAFIPPVEDQSAVEQAPENPLSGTSDNAPADDTNSNQ